MLHIVIGYQEKGKRYKFTSDRDCLSPEIDHFLERDMPDLATLKTVVANLETAGNRCCIDLAEYFYETE